MILLKRLFNFYINASLHVALSVYALTWLTLLQFHLDYDEASLCFVFFATISGYNFVKYFGLAKFHHRGLARWLKVIQVFSLVSFVVMCCALFYLETNTLLLIAILGVITFLYAIPLLPETYFIDDQKNLRQIGGLKIYVIALVWTFATVLLPLVNNGISMNSDVVVTGMQRYLFIIVLMLPFEIRDLNYDSLKLATIPQQIGVKKTKFMGVALLVLFFVLEYCKTEIMSKAILLTLLIVFITVVFVVFSNKNQSKYYSAFWVESIPIVWLAVLLMLG